jgi:hypothetical protein
MWVYPHEITSYIKNDSKLKSFIYFKNSFSLCTGAVAK